MAKINGPKGALLVSAFATLISSGCTGKGGGKAPELNLPEAGKISSISTNEYEKETYKVTDFCKNAAEIVLDSSNLPTYYTLKDNNTSLEVDLTSVDVPEENTVRTIPVKCKNNDGSIDVNVTSYELDTGNDSPTSITSSNLPTNIYVGQDYNGTVTVHDKDGGALSVSYDIIDKSDNSTVDSGNMNCVDNDSENSTCNFSISGLAEGNYTVNIEAQGVDGGEHDQPAAPMSKDFEVEAPASWNTADLDQEIEDNKNGDRNGLPRFDDSDKKTIIENISDFLNNSNDPIELLQDGIDDGNGGKIYPLEIENGSVVLKADGMGSLADQEYTFTLKSGNAVYTKTIYLNNN